MVAIFGDMMYDPSYVKCKQYGAMMVYYIYVGQQVGLAVWEDVRLELNTPAFVLLQSHRSLF